MIMMAISSLEDPNDREFIERLYMDHKELMLSTARRYISNPAECEDIVQTALVKLIEKIPELRGKKCCILRSYIVSTIRSTSIDHLRRNAVRGAHTVPLETLEELPAFQDSLAELAEGGGRLSEIWHLLPEEYQLALRLRYILDYSMKELAGALGCSEANARMKLTRARRKALQLLTEKREG